MSFTRVLKICVQTAGCTEMLLISQQGAGRTVLVDPMCQLPFHYFSRCSLHNI